MSLVGNLQWAYSRRVDVKNISPKHHSSRYCYGESSSVSKTTRKALEAGCYCGTASTAFGCKYKKIITPLAPKLSSRFSPYSELAILASITI